MRAGMESSIRGGLPQVKGSHRSGDLPKKGLRDKRVLTEGAFPQEGNSHRKGLPHRRELPWDGGLHRREIHIVDGCTGRTPTVSQGYSHAATDLRYYPKGRDGEEVTQLLCPLAFDLLPIPSIAKIQPETRESKSWGYRPHESVSPPSVKAGQRMN